MRYILFIASALFTTQAFAQQPLDDQTLDSLYIEEVQRKEPDKVLHAEPLYIDLIRDLGARKGEKEWNFGFGITDHLTYDTYEALIEYEFAPVDHLGLEVEIPVTWVAPFSRNAESSPIPKSRVESLKTALQWSFYVSPKNKMSMAVGYINELMFYNESTMETGLSGNLFNPFAVAAKRFGNNWHTLVYTGPKIKLMNEEVHSSYKINTNVHYMIPGTRNFVGLEINKAYDNRWAATLRPQMRLGISDNLLVGIISGVPVNRETQRFSMFTRLIWEPHPRKKT